MDLSCLQIPWCDLCTTKLPAPQLEIYGIQAARTEFSLGVWATEEKAAWAFDQAAIALGVSSAHDTTPQLGNLDNDSSSLRAAFNHSDLELHEHRPDFYPR